MTAAVSKGALRITCDSCPATFHQTAAPGEFRRLAELARADRWAVERHAGAWQHFCPACTMNRKSGRML